MSDLMFSGITIETVSASFDGRLETSYMRPNNGVPFSSTTIVTATHERVVYAGENLPPGLIGSGWTHVVKTIEGVTSETWSDDPTGSLYNSLYVDYGDEFDYDSLDFHGEIGDGSYAFRYGMRNENIIKRTEKFE